jgi:tetratricopeptide (TPR) repeat protein
MTDRGPEIRDEEELRFRRCPILYPRCSPHVGRERDISRLQEHLSERRVAVIVPAAAGVGATCLAAELAHASSEHYPGGAVWIRHHGSTPKEAAADVVEALELPTSSWLHWPFIGTDHARATMWRGLSSRGRTLIVVEGWPPWADAADWTPPSESTHVVALGEATTAAAEQTLFRIGQPARGDLEGALRTAVGVSDLADRIAELVDGDVLTTAIALARLRDAEAASRGAYAKSLQASAGREGIIVEAFAHLSSDTRTFVMALSCLAASPIPMSLIRALWTSLMPGGSDSELARSLYEVVGHGLAIRTATEEHVLHSRVLATVREQPGTWEPLYGPVASVLAEQLRGLDAMAIHKARRLVMHARHAAWLLEKFLDASTYDNLLESISASTRPFESSEAARKRVALARSAEPLPGPRTLETLTTLGHALSQLRELPESQSILREALEIAERVHGGESLEVASVIDLLTRAIGLGTCGQSPPEVLELKLRALSIRERAWGPDDSRLQQALWTVALSLAIAERREEAVQLLDRAVAIAERERFPYRHQYLVSRASALGSLGRLEEAVADIDRAVALQRESGSPEHVVSTLSCAEEFLLPARRYDDLLARLDAVAEWPELQGGGDADGRAQARARLRAMRARALHALGRRDEASEAAAAAIQTLEILYGRDDRRLASLRALVIRS